MTDLLPVNPFLVAALYYVLARAEVTRFLWSRYPRWLDRLSLCPACSGFWLGIVVGIGVGVGAGGASAGASTSANALYLLTCGATALVTTPILFGLMRLGFGAAKAEAEAEAETKDVPRGG